MHKRGPLSLLAFLGAFAAAAHAQDGGQVIQGGATITSPTATTTRIDQSTDRVIINWNGFSVGADSQVIFNQPGSTSVALNRVTGGSPSSILGSLSANGQIFLLNPNGIVFGQGSQVNVNALVASTLALSDSDFMSGNYRFTQDPGAPLSYVINQGTINAGSYAALVAPLVENAGTIASPGGDVLLLGTTEAVLNVGSTGLIGYSIGSVSGGNVNIKPEALSDVVRAVVNTTGLIEAGAVVENADGSVTLTGAAGTAVNSGTLTTEGVDGGSIIVNASTASALTLSSQLLSDAGLVEFSSQGRFAIGGVFDVASPLGGVGEILIDPNNITVIAGGSTLPGTPGFIGAGTDGSPLITTADGASITDGTIEALLGIGTVRIQTGTGAPNIEAGDIIINAEIDAPANGSSLILQAHNNILINADIDFTLSAGSLSLHADRENPGGFGVGGIFRSGGSTIRMGTGDLQLIASSGIGALGVPILTSGATDISIVNRGWAPIYLTNSGSNLNITNVFVSNAIGTTIGLSTWIGDVVLQNSGDITVSSLVRYTPTPTTWTQLPADPNFFTIGTMSLISGGSIFVNNVISSSNFTHVGDEPLDTHLQTGSFVLNAAGGIFGDAAGRIVTGVVTVNAGAGGNDDATSGSITLSGGGEIRFANPSALVTGNAIINNQTGGDDVATTGDITILTADKVSSDGGTGRLGILLGTPAGGAANFRGGFNAVTNGAAGNAGGVFLESSGVLFVESLTTANGNVNVRALNTDLFAGPINAGTGTVTLTSDDLPGGGFGNMFLSGNITSSALTAFAGGTLSVNGSPDFNGGPVSLTGLIVGVFGLSSDSDVTILSFAGDGTGFVQLLGVNVADSWTVTANESPTGAPSAGNDILVNGDLISTVGDITLRAGDDIVFQHNGSAPPNQEVTSAGDIFLRAAFQDNEGVGQISHLGGVGLSVITAGTLTAVAEDGITLGFNGGTQLSVGALEARNVSSGISGTPTGNISIRDINSLDLVDLSGSGFALWNQAPGTVSVFAGGNLSVLSDVSVNGQLTFGAQFPDALFTNAADIVTTNNTLNIVADRMDLAAGTITSLAPGLSFIGLATFSPGRLVDLGSGVDTTPGTLELSDAEFDTFQFPSGDGVFSVAGFGAGTIAVTQPLTIAGDAYLALNTGGDIIQLPGATIQTFFLDAAALGSVTLGESGNNVRFLAGQSGGSFTYTDADILSVNAAYRFGITSGGNVTLQTVNGDIGLDTPIVATAGQVIISAGGVHWIGDFNGAASNIDAVSAVLIAGNGIGQTQFSIDAIETNVAALQALNFGPGGIFVDDLSTGVNLVGLLGGNAVFNSVGPVSISAVSFVTVQDPVAANGDITLTAHSGGTSGDNVNVNDSIFSNGSVTLRAEDFIVLQGDITAFTRLTLHAAYNDLGGGGGSISHFSGNLSGDELVAIAENGISLGQFGGLVQFNQLQAINGGTSPNGEVAIEVDGNVELIGLTGGAALMNTAAVGSGNLTFSSPGVVTITDDILAVGSVTLSGSSIFDNACVTTINGAITLNGATYPVPGGGPNVFLGADACFHVYGPADYVQILFDGDPTTDLALTLSGDINVAGRVVLLSEGDVVILTGVTVTSGVGIIAMADWEGGDPDGLGQLRTEGTGLLRSNEFSFSAASGISVSTQSLNPALPALFQVRNASFDGVNNGSTVTLNHTGLAEIADLNLAFEPGSPGFEQDHTGLTSLTFAGGLFVPDGPAATDLSARGQLNINVNGAGAVLENDGTIRTISSGFIIQVDGIASQFVNDGTILALLGTSQVIVRRDNSLLLNNGTIQVTNGGMQLSAQNGVGGDVVNAGTLLGQGSVTLLNLTTGGDATNNGTITSNFDAVIQTALGGTSTNNGTITAGDDFVLIADGAGGVAVNAGDVVTFNNQFGEFNATTIRADRILLLPGSSIQVTDQAFVNLQASTAGRPIDLGSVTDLAAAVELSDAELDTIFTAPNLMYRLSIGTQVTGGPIAITAPLTLDGTGFVGALILNSGSTVTQSAPLFVPNHLVFRTGGAVTMNDPGNDAWQLTATVGGAFSYVDADEIGIASFLGIGVFSNDNDVTITTLNGPIRFGSPVPPPFGGTFSGGPINAGTGTVRLTAMGPNGYIQDLQNSGVDIIAHAAILVADAGIGLGSGADTFLDVQLDELQAINTGLVANRYIEIQDLTGDLVVRAIDPGVSTFGARNVAGGFGLVSIHALDGTITVNDPILAQTGWVWLFAPETAGTNNHLIINADITQGTGTQGIFLWAGDDLVIGPGGTAPNLAAVYIDLLPGYGDSDNISSLTQLSGTIVSNQVRAQSENGISLGALGGSTFDVNSLSLINTGLQVGTGTDIAPTGNVVVNNLGDLVLYEGFGNGMGLVNTAGAAGQGNLTITTTGVLTVGVPVFASRQVSLSGSSIVVNQRIASATGPILLNGTNYPTLTPNASVIDNTGGQFQVYAPGANPDFVFIWNDNNSGTDQDLVYSGGDVNVSGSVIIISEGDLTIPDGVTIQGGQGVVLLANWNFAYQNTSGFLDASGATLISNSFQLGAAQGIQADLQALGGTAVVQAQNTASGNVLINVAGNAVIDSLGQAFLADSPGLSTAGGGAIFFDASLALTLSADVVALGGGTIQLSAGFGIFDDGDQTTEIATTGGLFLDAGSGGIGNGGLDGTATAGYLDVSLGGVGTLTIAAGGDVFIQEVGAGTTLHSSQILAIDTSVVGIMLGLSSLTGDVDFDASFGAGAGAVVVVANDITIGNAAIVSPSDRITLIAGAGGSITQAAGGLLSATQLIVNAAGSVTLPSTSVRMLSAVAGGDVVITNTGDITLADLTGSGFAVDVDGAFTLSAHSTITVVAPVVAASVTLTADEAIAVLDAGRIEATAGDLLLSTTLGSIAVTVDSFTDTVLEATGIINLDSGLDVLVSDEDNDTTFATVQAPGGLFISGRDITLDGVIEGLTASLTASRDVSISGSGILTQDSLSIDADGDVVLSGVATESVNGFIAILAGGSFTNLTPVLATSAGGFVSVTALEGDITQFGPITAGQSVGLTTENGDIDVLGLISAPSVALFAPAGAVRSLNTALDVQAGFLQISAATGVGTLFTPLDTDVDVLFIVGNGDFYVREVDDLSITANTNGILRLRLGGALSGIVFVDDARIDAGGVVNLSTSVRALRIITTNDDIIISEGSGVEIDVLNAGTGDVTVTAAGAITGDLGLDLIANDAILSAVGGIDLDVQVSGLLTASSPGSPINLRSASSLLLGNVNAGASTVTIDAAGLLSGGVITASSALLSAVGGIDVDTDVDVLNASTIGGGINIVEADGLALGLLSAPAGLVDLTLTAGSIADGNGTAANVNALGFYAGAGAVGTAADPLETAVGGVEADASAGGVFLANTGDLVIGGVNVADGVDGAQVLITTSGSLVINEHVGAAGAISLTGGVDVLQNANILTSGAVTVTAGRDIVMANGTVTGSPASSITYDAGRSVFVSLLDADLASGLVFVTALAGEINDVDGGNAVDIRGFGAVLTAGLGIGITGERLDLQVQNVEADGGSGAVWLFDNDANGLIIGGLTTMNGVSSDGGAIRITADGNLTLGETINAGSGDVTLRSRDGAILDGNDGAIALVNVIGFQLILESEDGAGTLANPIETAVSQLSAINDNAGDIAIVNTGALTVLDVTNAEAVAAGAVSLDVAGDVLVTGAVSTAGGDILVLSSGTITVEDGASVISGDTLALTATTDIVICGIVSAVNAATLFAGEDIVICDTGVVTGNPLTMTAGGTVTVLGTISGGTIVSTGDIVLTNVVITGPSISYTSTAGDILISGASLTSTLTSIVLAAQGGDLTIIDSDLSAATDLLLSTSGNAFVGDFATGDSTLVAVDGALSLTAGGAVVVENSTLTAFDVVSTEGTVTISAGSTLSLSASPIAADGDVSLSAGADLSIDGAGATILAAGDLSITAAGDADLVGLFIGTNVTAQVLGDLTIIGGMEADGGQLTLFAVGFIETGAQLTATLDVEITGVAGVGLHDGSGLDSVEAGGQVRIESDGDILISLPIGFLADVGSVDVDAGGSVTIDDPILSAGAVNVIAAGGLTLLAGIDAAAGDIQLSSGADLVLVAAQLDAQNISVDAVGSVVVEISGLAAGSVIALTSQAAVTLTDSIFDAGDAISVVAGGAFSDAAGTWVAGTSGVSVDAAGITLNGTVIDTAGAVFLISTAGVDAIDAVVTPLAGLRIEGQGDVNLEGFFTGSGIDVVTPGDLAVTGTMISTDGPINLFAAGTVASFNAFFSTNDSVTIEGMLGVDLDGGLSIVAGGDVDIRSGGNIRVGLDINAGGDVGIEAGGDTLVALAINAGGDVVFDALGSFTLDGSIDAGGNVDVTAGENLSVFGDIDTVDGSISLAADGAVLVSGVQIDSDTSGGLDLTINGGIVTVIDGDLRSDGLIRITAVGALTLTDTDLDTDIDIVLTAGSLAIDGGSLTADFGGITFTAGADLSVAGAFLEAATGVNFIAGGDLFIGDDLSSTTITALDGDLITTSTGTTTIWNATLTAIDASFSGLVGSIDIAAGGDVILRDASLTADVDVIISAAGHVFIDPTTIIAGPTQGPESDLVITAGLTLTILDSTLEAHDNILLSAGGDVVISDSSATVTDGDANDDGSIQIESFGGNVSIADSSADAYENILVTAAGGITLQNVSFTAGLSGTFNGDIQVSAAGAVHASGAYLADAIFFQSLASMTVQGSLESLTGDLELFAAGTYASGAGYTSAADVVIEGLAGVSLLEGPSNTETLQAAGLVQILSNGAILVAQPIGSFLAPVASVEIDGGGDITLDDPIFATGDVQVFGGANLGASADITAGGAILVLVDLNATVTGVVTLSAVSIDMTAGGALTVEQGASLVSTDGGVNLTAADLLTIEQSNVFTTDGALVLNGGGVAVFAANLGADGDLAVVSTAGIQIGSSDVDTDGGSVTLTAAGAIAVSNGQLDADGGNVVATGASIALTNIDVFSDGVLNLISGGAIVLSNTDLDADLSILFDAAGAVSVTGGTVESDLSGVDIRAAGITLNGAAVDVFGDVVLASTAGVTINDTDVLAQGVLLATSSGDMALSDAFLTSTAITLTAGGALTASGGALLTGIVGDITITAATVAFSSGSVTAAGDLRIQSLGDAALDGTFSGQSVDIFALGDLTVTGVFTATTDDLLSDEELSIGSAGVLAGDAGFNSAGGIRLEGVLGVNLFNGNGGGINAAGDIEIASNGSIGFQNDVTTAGGSVDIHAGGSVVSNADLTATAPGQSVTIDAIGGITLDGSVTVSAVDGVISLFADNGNVEVGGAHTGFIVTWTANNGAIRDLDAPANNVTATNLTMSAATGIGTAADPIETNVANLTTSGGGDQFILEANSVAVNVNTSGTVSLTLGAGGALTGVIAAQTAILSAPASIDADTTVANLTATSAGAVTIDETDSAVVNVVSGTTADLELGSGTLSGSIAAAMAILDAPTIDVSTAVGTLTATGDSLTIVELDGLLLNDVFVTTATITAGGTITDADAGVNLTAFSATLTGTQIGSAGDFLSVDLSQLTATATGLAPATPGSLWINEASSLTAVDLTAGGLGVINLTTGGFITDNDADIDFSGNGVVVTATFFGTTANPIQTATTGLNVTATAGDIIVTETDGLTALNLDAADDVVLVAGGAITAFGGGTDVFADTATITAPSINVDTDVNTLIATATAGDVVIDEVDGLIADVIATGTADLQLAAGALTGTIAAASAVLDAPAGIDVDTAVDQLSVASLNGDIDVANVGDLVLTFGSAPSGSIGVATSGDLLVAADSAVAAGLVAVDIALTAGGDVLIVDADADGVFPTISALDEIRITAGGSIQQGTGSLGGTTLVLYAATGISILVADVDVLQATNAISGALVVYNAGGLTIQDLDGLGYGVENEGGDIVIESGVSGSIVVSDAISAAGQVTIESDGDLTIDADIDGTDIVLEALGAVTQTGGTISGDTLAVEAVTGIDLTATAVGAAQLLNTGSGDVSIVGLGDLVLADLNNQGYAILNTVGAVSAAAGGNLEIASDLTAGGTVDLTAGGAIQQTGGLLTGTTLTATSASGILLGQTDISVLVASTSATGDILVNNLGFFEAESVVAQDGDITLRATLGGGLEVSLVQALGHTVTIEAAGDVDECDPDAGADIFGLEVFITAGAGIGDAGTLEIDAVRATLTVTGVGGIDVVDTANGLDLVSAVAPSGVVRITSAGGPLIARLVTAGDDAFVSTTGAGDILLGLVQAGDQATITSASGSILDGNDQNGEALNVETGGNAFMTAGGVIGTLANCVEIQIGGTLTVSAGGSLGGTSISLCGTTGGGNPVIVIGSPGLTSVNGLEFLPLLQSARAAMNDLLDIRRRYDPILQRVLGDVTIWPPEVVEDERRPAPSQRQEEPKLPGESAEKKKD